MLIIIYFFLLSVWTDTLQTIRAYGIVLCMRDERKVDQLFMVSVSGNGKLSRSERIFLQKYQPGAILLFGFNVSGSLEDTRELTASAQDALKRVRAPVPVMVAIDHEGGMVYRFGEKLNRLASAQKVAASLSVAQTETLGKITGCQLRALGIQANLAPIVEPLAPWNRHFLQTRAYSDKPEDCIRYAASFARGLRKGGVIATLKHFPGNASVDPHKALPVWDLPAEGVKRYGLDIFRKALPFSRAQMVMLSHVLVPALDSERPASLSADISSILRCNLRFRGVIITDDLMMNALRLRYPTRTSALMALHAGSDMLIVSSRDDYLQARKALIEALHAGTLKKHRLNVSAVRIVKMKLDAGLWEERSTAKRKLRFDMLDDIIARGRAFSARVFRSSDETKNAQ